jgi:hypothetical protein
LTGQEIRPPPTVLTDFGSLLLSEQEKATI